MAKHSKAPATGAAKRFLRGHVLAKAKQRVLAVSRGARPEQAIAESLSAINAAAELGLWPAPRSATELRAIARVRRRWAKIQRAAKTAHARAMVRRASK